MKNIFHKRSKKAGLSPGTVVYVGEKKSTKTKVSIIDYAPDHYEEQVVDKAEDCFDYKDKKTNTWINIDGLHNVNLLQEIGDHFGIHPLVREDIVNTYQRPKMEDYGDYIYFILKMLYYNEESRTIEVEQVSIILGNNYVISFQEKEGDVFDPIRKRIKANGQRLIRNDTDYLTYTLIDAIVDNYFLLLEKMGEDIEELEDELLQSPDQTSIQTIHKMKREMITLRKSVWPLRELISGLNRTENKLIKKNTHLFFRDVYDHTIQVIDTIESLRDVLGGLLDLYLSSVSNRMNEVMKVLTIIATIFIPLTFIAGIYGMNFEYMPELSWKWSYFVVWGVMVIVAIFMLIYFKRKRWL